MKSNSNKKTSKDSTEKKKVRETIKTNLKSFQIKKKIKKKKTKHPSLEAQCQWALNNTSARV
jgi:hypothetical protein